MVILLRLLFAHILSDFFFQSDKICEGKQGQTNRKHVYQLLHSFIHASMAYLFVGDWSNWIIPSVIFISHILMDYEEECRFVPHRPACPYNRHRCLMVITI
ncbi:MAG: DUF3307 domain-containing protein [Bacteroidales bacterium]